MSISKHISLIKIVLSSLLALVVICYLTIGAKSQGSILTSNASEFYNDYESFINLSVNSGQWSIENNQIISYSWTWNPPASAPYESRVLQSINFVGTTTNNDELEFGVIVRNYNTNVTYNETSYFPSNTTLPVYDARQYVGGTPLTAYTIYVRRVDGGVLTPSSMETSLIQGRWIFRQVLQQTTAIPENWLETTTQTNLFIPLVTVTTPIETYQGSHGGGGGERGVVYDLNYYLEIPQEVAGVVSYIFYLFGQIASLKYVTTLICLAMVLGTLRFIMR